MSWVPFASMLLAAAALLTHLWAKRELRLSAMPHAATWGAMSSAAAMLAAIYSLGYAWLLYGDVERAKWSETMQWVGLVTWPLVWVLPGAMVAWVARQAYKRVPRE